jgi:uncharacterized Zn-binding protein involved in type VI secretion
MPKAVARAGVDFAGGQILAPGLSPTVTVNGAPIALVGNPVSGHGEGVHAAAVLAVGSKNVFVGATFAQVCGFGGEHVASCGHPVVSGSTNVFVN